MNKVSLSLNFMYCMERFATQIYKAQQGAFKGSQIAQKLKTASQNEAEHVKILRARIIKLNTSVLPFGFLFQFTGMVMGGLSRLPGKGILFKIDTWIETRAVRDYTSFVKTGRFDSETTEEIKRIIADEEEHILNWENIRKKLSGHSD